MSKKKEEVYAKMPVLNAQAAGIDVGSREHYVAVGQGKEHVKKFGVYTSDLFELCQWLKNCGTTTVALESTGSYWKNLFIMLQQHDLKPILVNGSFTKNLKGRKTDVLDCQFIQRMHSLGLLPDSFQPDSFTEQLRNLTRHRSGLISKSASEVRRISQSLRLMNIRLDVAVSDITGKTGMSIIKAILDGERNAQTLAHLCDGNIKKSKSEVALSLNGFYRKDYLFQLKQLVASYDFLQSQIVQVDAELNEIIEQHLHDNNKNDLAFTQNKKEAKNVSKNAPNFEIQKQSYQLFNGADLMKIPGVSHGTTLVFMSEVGESITKFSSAKAFSCWLRLSPNKKISGGKVIGNSIKHGANTLSIALRQAANTVGNMKKDIPIVHFFKRIAYKNGRTAAITATARKLAVIIWNMATKQEEYKEPSNEVYQQRIRTLTLKNMQKKIAKLKLKQEDFSFVMP